MANGNRSLAVHWTRVADSPFRERRLSPEEIQRVVKRAAELANTDPTSDVGGPLTADELETRLAELGIPKDVARRAMQPVPPAPAPSADGATRVEREAVIEGMVDPARFDEIADAIASVMKSEGRTSAVGNKLTWTPGGVLMEPAITVQAKDGQTRIRYVETLANRGQVLLGFGTLAGLSGLIGGGMGGAIVQAASGAHGGPMVATAAVMLGAGAAVASFLGLKRLVARRATTRAALAEQVLAHVGAAVHASLARAQVKARVELSAEPELEAEAEELERRRSEA